MLLVVSAGVDITSSKELIFRRSKNFRSLGFKEVPVGEYAPFEGGDTMTLPRLMERRALDHGENDEQLEGREFNF